MRSPYVTVMIELERIRAALEAIRAQTGVPVIAVVKADAYGLGAPRVADALQGVADEFAYFSLAEARKVGLPGIILGPADGDPRDYIELNVRPGVRTLEALREYARARPALNVDTGMQRFGCAPDEVAHILKSERVHEAFTHAESMVKVRQLKELCGDHVPKLHAANSALLEHSEAWLSGVRPGIALYRDAVRVTTRLAVVRATSGPVGYGGFDAPRVGVILAGYSNHLAKAPLIINGRPQRILEIGMNSAYVTVAEDDRVGDEVTLLGDELSVDALAGEIGIRPHEVLCRYAAMGRRRYR